MSNVGGLKRPRPWAPPSAPTCIPREFGPGPVVVKPLTPAPQAPHWLDAEFALPFSGLNSTRGTPELMRVAYIVHQRGARTENVVPPRWKFHVRETQEIATPTRASDDAVCVGGFRIDSQQGSVDFEDGCPTDLNDYRRKLFGALSTHPDGIKREPLLAEIGEQASDAELGTHLQALRRRFGMKVIQWTLQTGFTLGTVGGSRIDKPAVSVSPLWTLCPKHEILMRPGFGSIHLGGRNLTFLCELAQCPDTVVTYGQMCEALRSKKIAKKTPACSVARAVHVALRKFIDGLDIEVEEVHGVGFRLNLRLNVPQDGGARTDPPHGPL